MLGKKFDLAPDKALRNSHQVFTKNSYNARPACYRDWRLRYISSCLGTWVEDDDESRELCREFFKD